MAVPDPPSDIDRGHRHAASFREQFLEALLESATDYAIIATDLDGLITAWNEGARRILGWTEAEIIGRPASVLFTAEDCDRGVPQAEMQSALAQGRSADERWHRRRDGALFWAIGELMPLRDEAGEVPGFLKILRDRTVERRAAEALRADAEFLRSVLAASADCLKVLDLDGRLLFMSEGGQRVMEVRDFAAISGCPWPDFWQVEGGAQARAAVAEAVAGGTGRFQGAAPTMAGTPKIWDVQVTPIPGADGRPEKLLAVSRDITASRDAEMALLEAQGVNTLILNSSRDCIVVLDLEGHTQFVSPGGIEAMEVADLDAILGRSWLRLWTGDDAAPAHRAVARARADGIGRFQGFCPTHTGTPKWWDVMISPLPGLYGSPERLVAVGRDITELKRAELALKELNDTLEQRVAERTQAARLAEARFRGIFDSTYQLIWLVGLDGTVLEANRAALDAAGIAPADTPVPIPVWEAPWFRHSPEAVAILKLAFPAAASGGFVRRELKLVLPEDQVRIYDFSLSPVRDERGEVVFLVAESRDITDLRMTEEHLRQSQKMEAVGQLTGGLAHDFSNLLTGITGSLDLLQSRVARGRVEDLDVYITAAQDCARRAAALTHRLLAFARRQTLEPKPVDVNQLVADMAELIRRTVTPSIALNIHQAVEPWPALVDPNQLENALLNLCINARDAMPEGGRIAIETANEKLDRQAAAACDLPAGEYLTLSVIDSGVGMSPEVAARAFDPFFTTKPAGSGTGLGLSMIYGFVRQSGGQAVIRSTPGQGTKVCLYLPRHVQAAHLQGAHFQEAGPGALPPAGSGAAPQRLLKPQTEPAVPSVQNRSGTPPSPRLRQDAAATGS